MEQRLTASALNSQSHPNSVALDSAHGKGEGGNAKWAADNRPSISGFDVTVAGVDEYKLASKPTHVQEGSKHSKSTSEHGSAETLKYQHLSAAVTHTQGDGTAGIHHQQVNAHASAARMTHSKTHQKGPASAKTELNVAAFHAEGEAGLRLNTRPGQQQAIAYASGKAQSGAHATVHAQVSAPHASLVGKGEAKAGAFVEAQGGIVIDRQKGDAFGQVRFKSLAGAEIKGQGQAQVGPFIAYAGGGLKTGVGYDVYAGGGMKDGVLKAQVNLGGALGVGASASAGLGFDTNWTRQHLHRPDWAHFHRSRRHPAQATG